MPAIRSLTLVYDALNEDRTFSEGDLIAGKVTLAVEKPTAVQSFFVKVKGDAQVRWTTRSGNHNQTHSASRRYFKLKHFFIETVLPQGVHVYNFRFTIPSGTMPSSFKGTHGKIVYILEAKLLRSWKVDKTADKVIIFRSKSIPHLQSLMLQQVAVKDKELGIFSSGKVHMKVTVDKTAYAPGETVLVVAKINNNSSSDMIPKVRLSQVIVYSARSSSKHESITINKLASQNIGPRSEKEVRWAVKIPTNQEPTIKNCEIISVEYSLKVYLDISFAFDPEVTFPVIIIPPNVASSSQGAFSGPSWAPHNSDFPPAAASAACYPPSPHRGQGAQAYLAPSPFYSDNPTNYAGPSTINPSPVAPMAWGFYPGTSSLSSSSSSFTVVHPLPNPERFHSTAPTFPPNPSPPGPSAPPVLDLAPSAPSYEPPSYTSTTNFLSQSDEPPPAYSLIFPPSAKDE
ncbi:arrestin domain-containing protein 3 isoform X2 [Syngnathoides biaculeatus]|uniref:arrestin domain-containing protein 3 isoform X2 n=1 Tax=Syngnathoides biaculeatus TaxID=300417 RepID=UPI002ADD4D75|nr:arrestin domain-containing protein 3 isoform X2 [Syngnathoides biaculeatus]